MNHSKINRPRQINGLTAIQHLHGNEMAVYLAVLMAEMIVKYGKGLFWDISSYFEVCLDWQNHIYRYRLLIRHYVASYGIFM
jgi:hypothetical protein